MPPEKKKRNLHCLADDSEGEATGPKVGF